MEEGWCHLDRCWREDKYSLGQRNQTCWTIFYNSWYLDNLLSGFSTKLGCGTAFNGAPIRKCLGVKGVRSFDGGTRGREFSTTTICVKTVVNSSNVNLLLPTIRVIYLADLIIDSQSPHWWGKRGVIKCYSILFWEQKLVTESSLSSIGSFLINNIF